MNEHLSADRLIGHHRTREDYVHSPFNTLQFGYGTHRYVKFTFQLLREPDLLKKKILTQLIQDFALCDNIDLCLSASDMLSVLLQHLKHKDGDIRVMAATLIKSICGSAFGRKMILDGDCVDKYEELINDERVDIRSEVYEGLIRFTEQRDGIQCILKSGHILNHLVAKLVQEQEQSILLKTVILLNQLMEGEEGTPKALKTPIIERLINLITHQSQDIVKHVCRTLTSISFNAVGKQAIVEHGYIKHISPFIKSESEAVREAGCLLLCSLAQLNQGKVEILNQCPLEVVDKLLGDCPETVLNCVQLIASLAEHSTGRERFSQLVDKLEGISSIDRKYIEETVNVIKWKP